MKNKVSAYLFWSGAIIAAIILPMAFPARIAVCQQPQLHGLLARTAGIAALCLFFCFFRLSRGPQAPDRLAAFNILGIIIVGISALLGACTQKDFYIDIGIAWTIQSFIMTLAFSKTLEGKDLDE